MRRFTSFALALAALFVLPLSSEAQSFGITPELRAGLAFPTGDVGDVLDSGYGVSGALNLNVTSSLAVYGGYSHNSFDFENADGDVSLNGFDMGARLSLPMAGLSPYVKGGAAYYKFDDEGESGDRELGFQVGVGLDYALGNVLTFVPEVSYTSIDFGGGDVNFWRTDVGLKFRI